MWKLGIFFSVKNAETLTVSNEVKNEVKDMFTSDEWNLMYIAFRNYGLNNETVNGYQTKEIKEANLINSIVSQCEKMINYFSVDDKWRIDKNVDKYVFMKKLKSLNYDKALAVYEIVDDYLHKEWIEEKKKESEKTGNLLDYRKVALMEYKDQKKLLEEKLESGPMRTFNNRFLTVYYDKDISYIDNPELECFEVINDNYETIGILAEGQVQSYNSDIGKRLEDIVLEMQLAQMSNW